ncbi:MAG: RNA 2',3'-cyclic phosphodiesterase [Bacteroidota bacterium]
MASIRTFIAIPTPDNVRQVLSEIQAELKTSRAEVKWEPHEKLHITLRFLGNVDERQLPQLMTECSNVVCNLPSFSLIYEGLGCFPDTRNPRIIWAGSHNDDGTLVRIKKNIDDIVVRYGFERENRSFHPHITLARVKGRQNIPSLIKMFQSVTFEPHPVIIDEVHFMKSELRSTGSIYTRMQIIALQR